MVNGGSAVFVRWEWMKHVLPPVTGCSLGRVASTAGLGFAEVFDHQACLVHSEPISHSVASCIFTVLFFCCFLFVRLNYLSLVLFAL